MAESALVGIDVLGAAVLRIKRTVLAGEVMGFDEVNRVSYIAGYFDRDYEDSLPNGASQ